MAEATDRPQEALPGPAWPAEGVTLSPAPEPTAPATYRPVSGVALAGFLLAVLYAVAVALGGLVAFVAHHPWWLLVLTLLAPPLGAVAAALAGVRGTAALLRVAALSLVGLYALLGVGGLVAYSGSNPWLLPGWTILLPLAAAALAWFARGRIRDSEGTLGGATLAVWGLGLSLFFGLTYVAYYAGAYVAVRQQAQSFARDWVDLIAQGKLERAFLKTVPVRDRPGDATRADLEMHTMSGEQSGYGTFCQTDFVRALQMGGPATQIRPLGIVDWVYKSGNPEVKARFRVESDVLAFDLLVTALGSEAKAGEGRQWQVMMQTTGRPRDSEFVPTPKGLQMIQAFEVVANLAQSWFSQVGRHDWDQAYLATLPPAERESQHQGREACDPAVAVAAGLTGLAANPRARDYLAGRARLFSGELIDQRSFWAPTKRVRDEVPARLRGAFRLDEPAPAHFELRMSRVPLWERDGDRFRFLVDGQIQLRDPGESMPAFVADVQLAVEGDAPPDGYPQPDSWRVRRLDLVRGRTGGPTRPSQMQRGPGGPGGPAAPRAMPN
jgi:hypothetical protein